MKKIQAGILHGVDDVLVGGVPVVANRAFTDHRPGRVLRSGTDSL